MSLTKEIPKITLDRTQIKVFKIIPDFQKESK